MSVKGEVLQYTAVEGTVRLPGHYWVAAWPWHTLHLGLRDI